MLATNIESNPIPIFADSNGNSFLIFDYIQNTHHHDPKYVRSCHAPMFELIDSALVLEKLYENDLNIVLKMFVYEPGDGFCGNGARAVSHFLHKKYPNVGKKFCIQSDTLLHSLIYSKEAERYYAEMGPTVFEDIYQIFSIGKGSSFNVELPGGKIILLNYSQTAEPHLITFDDISEEEHVLLGKLLNNDEKFKKQFPIGINVNKVLLLKDKPNSIFLSTFERGIERVTKACGTGSVSAVALCIKNKLFPAPKPDVSTIYNVECLGGTLNVLYLPDGKILLGGRTTIGIDVVG